MVLGYHAIFSAYGFWLPNDPRGSWSDFVGAWELFRFGAATNGGHVRSVAGRTHDVAVRRAAKQALQRPAVRLTGLQARAVGTGFACYADKAGLRIWACAILPDHVHLVVGRHRLSIESIVIQLKAHATRQLIAEGIHPCRDHLTRTGRPRKCFARGQWAAYLDDSNDIRRAVRYVEANPEKERLPRQRWRVVTPYTG